MPGKQGEILIAHFPQLNGRIPIRLKPGNSRIPFCAKLCLAGKTDSSEQSESEAKGRWHLPYICLANVAICASYSENFWPIGYREM